MNRSELQTLDEKIEQRMRMLKIDDKNDQRRHKIRNEYIKIVSTYIEVTSKVNKIREFGYILRGEETEEIKIVKLDFLKKKLIGTYICN